MSGFRVKSNLKITLRERGKIVARREGHNIWLDFGRVHLAKLLCFTSFSPLTAEEDNRVSYMGFGIGGTQQIATAIADNDPMLSHYPGTNVATDAQPELLKLERPARFGWTSGPSAPTGVDPLVYDPGDIWLKQIQTVTHPTTSSTRFSLTATAADFNDSAYLVVPLSEVGLFHRGASVQSYNNSPVAYDTFDAIQKTGAFDLNVSWTIRF